MKILIKNIKEAGLKCDALILPVLEKEGIALYKAIDESMGGVLGKISREFKGKHNEVSLLHTYGKIKPEKLLLIGLGKKKELTREKLRQAGGKAVSYLRDLGVKEIALSTRLISMLRLKPSDFIEGGLLSDYRFLNYKEEKDHKAVKHMCVISSKDLTKEIKYAEVTASSVLFARGLINTPSNDMTPALLFKAAKALKAKNVSVRVIDGKEAQRLGMGAYLSVARGSEEPPKFIVVSYAAKKTRPVVLIGKSITFDSGGISLKPAEGMEKMKYDMAGGAAVLGVIKAAAELGLPLCIVGLLPATENLPGGSASKPGDVVRAIEGKTIEIISTDAEGRMTIADALGYAKRFKPRAVIDIATLTGACSIALGGEAIALMGNDEGLMEKLRHAGEETGERLWRMPLFDEYKEYIKSDVADIKNSSGKQGALVTAGYFLKEFAGETPWAHLDIAGTAWTDKDKPYTPKGATGVGVRLLLEFLREFF